MRRPLLVAGQNKLYIFLLTKNVENLQNYAARKTKHSMELTDMDSLDFVSTLRRKFQRR